MYKATFKLKSDPMFEEERMSSPVHVLVVGTETEQSGQICAMLTSNGYTCEQVATGREALDLLASYTPTLMLLHCSLADMTVADLLTTLKEWDLVMPFAIICGSENTSEAVQMMKLGARDYLVTDQFFPGSCVPAIQRIVNELAIEERLRQAESALRESEERLRATIASLDDLLFVLDRNGILIDFYHPEHVTIFNPRHRFLGHPYWAIGLPADAVRLLAKAIAELKENGKTQTFDYHLDKTGGVQWYSAKASVRRDAFGRFDGITIVSRNITERKKSEEKLFYLSTRDTLTGAFNRAYFEEELERLGKSRHLPVSIVMSDLVNLKRINDTQGYAAGDALLKLAAKGLMEAFRAEDVVARVGDDEFAVILPDTDEDAVQKSLERAKEHIVSFRETMKEPLLNLSFGWATASTGAALPATLKKADKRLHQDKKSPPAA
jgi:diguanylate cyclase (GGDEF)-like protein